jgi:type I restriction enzyme M protein
MRLWLLESAAMNQKSYLSPAQRRAALSALHRDRLAELTFHFGLELLDRRVTSQHLEALAEARDIDFEELLKILQRDELKVICARLGLDTRGREKQSIIDRILARNGSAPARAGVDEDAAPRPGQLALSLAESREPEATAPVTRRVRGRQRRTTTRAKAAGSSDHAILLRELWQAAVNLRGAIEPADYKRYVLPIIFLRFLSLRFESRHRQLESLIGEPGSEYYTTDSEVGESILEDADEYRREGAFVIPSESQWDYLRKNAQADDIKIRVDRALEALEDAYPQKLKGLLPSIFAGSNLSQENVAGLIDLFSKDIFRSDHGGADLLGKVYEYFIGGFADSEGKRGGEYFTPVSIVRTLVAMLEPVEGVVFDPCCGSGGMFVQSDLFARHNHLLSFYGQESKEFTYRLGRMNLFIHGLDGEIRLGNSYIADQHARLQADYVLANPPFNDGSKGQHGWGADQVARKDLRLKLGDDWMELSPRNANTMWMLHFLYHLKEGGTAGFVMATGELSNQEKARLAVRKSLVEEGYVDCIVQLTGQLFANTQIPCSLWFLSKNRGGSHGYRRARARSSSSTAAGSAR